MHLPFLTADPHSGLHYRPTDTRLAELSLAPLAAEWTPGRVIAASPDPVWAESLANAPVETIAAVTAALEDLVLATPGLHPPAIDALPEGRARRHLAALVGLWRRMGEALPEGLAAVRHVLELPKGRLLDPLPVVDGSLDPLAPACMKALHDRLRAEFGTVPAPATRRAAAAGTRLHAVQAGLAAPVMEAGALDDSLAFFGLRDPAACADFAAARARALIESGIPAREIAVLAAGEPRQLARAFAAQGVPLSGLPADLPRRDLAGEAALHLALAKRTPTPAMVLASLALSPLMPWPAQTGRDLSESLMGGDFRGRVLDADPAHKALWQDIRASAGSLQHLRFLLDRICDRLADGATLHARLSIPPGDGTPDWEAILRAIQIAPPIEAEPVRNLEGVSLWSAQESPWRPCRHLIVSDFTEGLYPAQPRANPLFLDSEIAAIRTATGLQLRGRAEGLARALSLFDQQLQAASGSVTFLIPWRDLAGARLAPSAGLSMVARAITGADPATRLITDLSRVPPSAWPVAHHHLPPAPMPANPPDALHFPGLDLLALRRDAEGIAKPQSPSRLETLLVSPLAWLLDELGASGMEWAAEELDVMLRGNIAHHVFEHVFPVGDLPDADDLPEAVAAAYDDALTRHAGFLRNAIWDMERAGLEREIREAALRWLGHLHALGARVIGNEIWLAGEAHGIRLHGKADAVLELPDRALLVVDHKKSGTRGRRQRMEKGWDLQAGLYRDMIARPIRREDDGMAPLIGHGRIGIAYHLMNDGGLLTSGLNLPEGSPARDMGGEVNAGAIAHLRVRLAELGSGRVVMNTVQDEKFYRNEAGFTPYALTQPSVLVGAFIRPAEEE